MCNKLSTLVLLLKKSCSSSGLDFGLLRDFQIAPSARHRRARRARHSLEVAPRLLRGCYHQTPRRAVAAAACRRFYPLVRPSVVTAAPTKPTAAASSSLSAQPPSIVSLCFSLSLSCAHPSPIKLVGLVKREATVRRGLRYAIAAIAATVLPPVR